jgi:hypothetical protein
MLINFCYADDRLTRKMRGEHVTDPEQQYKKLKKIQPEVEILYQKGQISEEKYKSFMDSIAEYESRGD